MGFSFSEILSATMVLFAVIDIVGSIPLIVSLRERVGHIQSEKATVASVVIMVLFLFFGDSFLHLFGVDIHSFAVAGSFVLFFLAMEMILGIRIYRDAEPESASIVPIIATESFLHSLAAKIKLHSNQRSEWPPTVEMPNIC
jgi:multiple antibiotic resistance protein